MGNAVTLGIVLDNNGGQSHHRAGTNLTGTLLVQVHKKMNGETIVLIVKGKETSSVRLGKQTRYASRDFFQAKLVLHDLEQSSKVNAGSYSFPFSIALPGSLPSSFCAGSRGSSNSCSIQYKCVASVGRATAHETFCVASMPIMDRKVPCFVEPKTQEITSMGLLSKGSVTFGARVDGTHIGKGQELVLSVACRNNTTVDIEHVCVKIVERTTWRVNANWEQSRKKELVGMTELNLPGLVTRRKRKQEIQHDKRAGPEAIRQSNFQQIYDELSSGRSSIRIRIPPVRTMFASCRFVGLFRDATSSYTLRMCHSE